jgi:UDP-GlcNAc3NAcA epimerase
MSGIFFAELDVAEPNYNLCIGSMSQGKQTGRMLEEIESVLIAERPDWVLVYGDTNSTLAGALAATKLHIPVAHVEAGLRSFNRRMPEEVNRVLTDHVSELLFAPTTAAVGNLCREGIAGRKVVRTGDVMYDVARFYATKAERESTILDRLGLQKSQYILATVHRAENTDNTANLSAILQGLIEVGREIPVVLPIHPRTRAAAVKLTELPEDLGHLHILEPVGYLEMMLLEKNARLIVTDSGGVQKEATFHNVFCVTLRGETEWTELVELGRNTLVPPLLGAAAIANAVRAALERPSLSATDIYGDGHAAETTVEALLQCAKNRGGQRSNTSG